MKLVDYLIDAFFNGGSEFCEGKIDLFEEVASSVYEDVMNGVRLESCVN